MSALRIGIAGLGVISGVHLEAIQNLETGLLVAACDLDPAKKLEEVPFYTSLEEMLRQEDLDCVHICLPHHEHVGAVLLCEKYGVHAFVEKPIGLDLADINRLGTPNIKVGTCLQNRYNPTSLALKNLIEEGTFGNVVGTKAVVTWNRGELYYKKDPWRGKISEAGGGVMLSQAVHTLDLLYLVGGPVSWVKGLAGNLLREEIEVEDTAAAHIQFKGGSQGIFYGTVTHCFNSQIEVEVVLEKAVAKIKDSKLLLYVDGREEILAEDIPLAGRKSYYGTGHQLAISAFYEAIQNGTTDYITIEEATHSVAICEGVMKSAASGSRIYFK